MDAMIKLYAQYKETVEKQSMGFKMSAWDEKLLKYGEDFEKGMMDLSVNIPLEDALDLGWKILADCFEPAEVGIKTDLIERVKVDEVRCDDIVYVLNCFEYAFTKISALVAVAQLYCFVYACGSSARYDSASACSVCQQYFNFNCRIAA
jgi:hypothetical protein